MSSPSNAMRHALLLTLLLMGCTAERTAVQVYAAASTERAVRAIVGTDAQVNAAASSTLARQIEAGAPADIVLLANQRWMRELSSLARLDGPPAVVFTNSMVVVVPRADTSSVEWRQRLRSAPHIALGDPDHVPAGQYARAALRTHGVWDELRPRVVSAADVRAAAALVSRGEASVGIVYATDVDESLRIVHRFGRNDHPAVAYTMAIVKGHKREAVQKIFDRLRQSEVFEQHGFERWTPDDAR